jgi:hypothetical protein
MLRIIQQQRAAQERQRQEAAERKQMAAALTQQQKVAMGLSKQISDLIKSTPQGIRDTFGTTVQDAERWINTVQKTSRDIDTSGSNASLSSQLRKISSQKEEGQKYLNTLIQKFTKDADTMEKSVVTELLGLKIKFEENKESITRLAGLDEVNRIGKDLGEAERCTREKKLKDAMDLKNRAAVSLDDQINSITKFSTVYNQYEQEMDLLKPWFDEEMRIIDNKFDGLKVFLGQEKYADFSKNLSEIQKNLELKIQEAKELEEKNQKRSYVLESLKKVCTSMGFEEVGQSVEGKGKSNRIVYTIDTFSQGKIKFYLSLDTIDADSGIADNHCMSEFDKVSESLQKNFGVQTQFKRVLESAPERLIRKGELDEPDGVEQQNSAG